MWKNVGISLPLIYRISAAWASREGPLMMWAAMLAGISWIYRRKHQSQINLPIIDVVTVLLWLATINMTPFELISTSMPPAEMNALLQTTLMVIHPPIIFLFYSLVLFMAQYDLENSIKTNHFLGQKIALLAFSIGTIGLGLGGLWAFTVLDWGGYWAWDPVETASLIPWLFCAIRLHLPYSRLFESLILRKFLCLGLIGSTIFAALVTRAGGVWASVHAFVGSSDDQVPNDGLRRLISASTDSFANVEIVAYFSILLFVLIFLIRILSRQDELGKRELILLTLPTVFSCLIWGAYFSILLLLIISFKIIFSNWKISKNDFSQLDFSIFLIFLLCGTITFFLFPKNASQNISWHIDGLVTITIIPLIFGYVFFDKSQKEIFRWVSVFLVMISTWVGLVGLLSSAFLIVLFLVPWVFSQQEKDATSLVFSNPRKFVRRFFPLLGFGYVAITLLSLFASMDSPQFGLHEVLGAPIIWLALLTLPLAHLHRKIEFRQFLLIILLPLFSTLFCGFFLMDALPGDIHLELTGGGISRGMLAMFLLPAALISLAGLIVALINQTNSFSFSPLINSRRLGTIAVHLGFVVLFIGHIFSTTLVARGDLGHVVTITEDVPLQINGNTYYLESIEFLSSEKIPEEYERRIGVGDRYVGLQIAVNGLHSDEKHIINPGVVHFDRSSTSRSEVDRIVTDTGVIIVLLDSQQASEIMLQSQLGNGIDRVRLTIYELPANQLVWIGWSWMVCGTLLVMYTRKNPN